MPLLRSLARTPGYTAVALLILALGIGLNTSMFSLISAVMFDFLPFREPGRLVQVVSHSRQGLQREYAEVEQRELKAQASTAFESLTTFWRTEQVIGEPGRPVERVPSVSASSELFSTFSITPLLGRPFTEEETRQGRNQVVLLGHAYWQQRFAGDPQVLGRTLRLEGETVTIIGVMPPDCEYPALWGRPALWRPLNFTPDQLSSRDYQVFLVFGRLRQGLTRQQAAATLAPLAESLQKQFPQRYVALSYEARPLREALMDDTTRRMHWMLAGLAGFVLLIACANLANLQLARATAGLRDLAIRSALGASRARLIGEQLMECLILSLAGGALGLLVAKGVNHFLETSYLVGAASQEGLRLNLSVLALTTLLSLLTGVLFGITPAWLAARMDLNTALKQRTRGASLGHAHRWLRNGLIVSQVALALTLLSGAAILHRNFSALLKQDSGWDTRRVLFGGLTLSDKRYDNEPKRYEAFLKVERALSQLPGVEAVAIASSLPLEAYTGNRPVFTEGLPSGPGVQDPRATHAIVTAGYFKTLGIPFLEGRNFEPELKMDHPKEVVINESLARHLWPGQSALGRRIRSDDSGWITWSEVIGVVRDVNMAASFNEPPTRFQVYKNLAHEPWGWSQVVLRSSTPGALVEDFRRTVAAIDPDFSVEPISTVEAHVARQHRTLLLVGELLTGFALLGLLLASIGLASVISQTVVQRTQEFGIRLALGAQPRDLFALVLRYGLSLSLLGLALGLLGAAGLDRLLATLMPKAQGADPLLLALVCLTLLLVTLLACWLPARKATKVDPLLTLRSE